MSLIPNSLSASSHLTMKPPDNVQWQQVKKHAFINTLAVRFALLDPIVSCCLGSQSFSASRIQAPRHWHLETVPCPSCWAGLWVQSCQLKSLKLGFALLPIHLVFAEISSLDLAFPGIFITSMSTWKFSSPFCFPRFYHTVCDLPASIYH